MSRYRRFKPDRVDDYPLDSRPSKVQASDFAKPFPGGSFSDFLETLPNILAVPEIKELVKRLLEGKRKGRGLIWGFGGHVIKVGLGPILIDLMRQGFCSAFATNGAGLIHDFEIALCGNTSEDVERSLKDGSFGMARETGQYLNEVIKRAAPAEMGIGEAVGGFLEQSSQVRFPEASLFLAAYQMGVPVSVHVAFGTDIIHSHPLASGAAVGTCTQIDFQIFTQQVSRIDRGGAYLNLGSAVLLPEVFLKAVTLIRNAGQPLEHFTTANFDFLQHYRPLQNVVKRPVAETGRGFALTGHHEIMIPLLAAMLRTAEGRGTTGVIGS